MEGRRSCTWECWKYGWVRRSGDSDKAVLRLMEGSQGLRQDHLTLSSHYYKDTKDRSIGRLVTLNLMSRFVPILP
jgi:hypothetical protein